MRLLLLAATVPLVAADWAGSGACQKCHAAHSDKHAASAHALALRPAREHPLAPLFRTGDKPLLRDGFLFAFTGDSAEGYDRENQVELPLDWAFGSGKRAVSFVSRLNAEWHLEHSFSYYPVAKRFLASPGQTARPASLKEAAGLPRDREETARCFACHASGPARFAVDGSVEVREAGVQCEGCHGPASDHVARKAKLGPRKKASGEVCARCHDQAAPREKAEAWAVRNQVDSLKKSACFVKSKGKLGCVTCHDPHSAGVAATGFNAKCGSCHKKLPKGHGGDCVECHMPRSSPQAGWIYSNHWIGVYGDASKLVPVVRSK